MEANPENTNQADDFRVPETVLNALDDAVLICSLDAPYTVFFTNPALARIRGARRKITNAPFSGVVTNTLFPGSVTGPSFARLFVSPPEKRGWDALFADIRMKGEPYEKRLMLRPGDRSEPVPVPVDVHIRPVDESDGGRSRFVAVVRDIRPLLYAESERDAIAKNLDCVIAQLSSRALQDTLTGLPNRAFFFQKFEQNIAVASRDGSKLGLAMIDIGRLVDVDETFGHAAGEKLLLGVVASLKKRIRGDEYLVRWTDARFLWIVPGIRDESEFTASFSEVLKGLAEVGHGVAEDSRVSASIGHAVYPYDGDTPDELVGAAGEKLRNAKESAGGAPSRFGARVSPVVIARRLLDGVKNAAFGVACTPVVELAGGRTVALKCAITWRDARIGEMHREDFLPIAERTGLIAPMRRAMMNGAMERFAASVGSSRSMRLVFDLSPAQLVEPDFVLRLTGMCRAHGVEPSSITLKFAARIEPARLDATLAIFSALSAEGFKIALDRFGGTADQAAFFRFEFDEIHLDPSVVAHARTPRGKWALESSVKLCRETGALLVATGVDSEENVSLLRRAGVTCAKGRHFGVDMHPTEILSLPQFR